jgi:mannosyl-oligosaccharide alpha-1,2-mannosidase
MASTTLGKLDRLESALERIVDICRNAWGASAVDALSTALVMQQKDIVNQIIDYIPKINYGNTSTDVSLFETTIRYLGGMLSGYDFLTGPLADLADNVCHLSCTKLQTTSLYPVRELTVPRKTT